MGVQNRKPCFDWLPPGWKMDVRVRNSGKKDRYYIDPVSGYAFRSMNEVFRYLDTGKIGRRAFKPKNKDLMKRDSRDHALFSNAEAGKLRSRKNSKARKLVPKYQNTTSDAEAPLMQIIHPPKFAGLKPCERKETSSEFIFPVVGKLVVDLHIEKTAEMRDIMATFKEQKKIVKRGSYLTQRTSKQIAGGEVELPQVLEAWNRACQAEARSTDAHEDMRSDKCKGLLNSEDRKRSKTGNDAHKKDDLCILTPSDDVLQEEHVKQGVANVLLEEHARQGVNEYKGPEQQEIALASSFGGLWNDPCIEFAIKTLTGDLPVHKGEEVAKNAELLRGFHNAGSASCQDLPHGGVWTDPCFGFAVKTSLGNKPTEDGKQVGNVLLQQKWSSKSGGVNWPTFADYRLAKFSWTNG